MHSRLSQTLASDLSQAKNHWGGGKPDTILSSKTHPSYRFCFLSCDPEYLQGVDGASSGALVLV